MRHMITAMISSLLVVGVAHAEERPINIADVIQLVRCQLIESERRLQDAGLPALFRTKQFELELSFLVRRSARGGGSLQLWVVNVEGGADYAKEEVQKIKLVFDTEIAVDKPTSGTAAAAALAKARAAGYLDDPESAEPPVGLHPGGYHRAPSAASYGFIKEDTEKYCYMY